VVEYGAYMLSGDEVRDATRPLSRRVARVHVPRRLCPRFICRVRSKARGWQWLQQASHAPPRRHGEKVEVLRVLGGRQ